jgi:hypothetical protein
MGGLLVSNTTSHIFIAYDAESGEIVGVHHGPADSEYEWKPKFDAYRHVAILRAPFPGHTREKRYAVDILRKQIIETVGEQGISFGFGETGRTWQKS